MYYHKLPVEERCFPYNRHLLGSLTLKVVGNLPFKVSFKIVADDILKHFFFFFLYFSEKIKLDISCELSAYWLFLSECFYIFYKCANVSIDPIAFFTI